MEANSIVERARLLGVTLTAAGDRIQYAPKSRTPPDLVEALRSNKREVLFYLNKDREEENCERKKLLSWAAHLAEENLLLSEPVTYAEAPLRTVTTYRISWYAAQYLAVVTYARLQQQNGSWGMFTAGWWQSRESDAYNALCNLRNVCEHVPVLLGRS
jgi:hypothetical protein